jgi:hypothetical protein
MVDNDQDDLVQMVCELVRLMAPPPTSASTR